MTAPDDKKDAASGRAIFVNNPETDNSHFRQSIEVAVVLAREAAKTRVLLLTQDLTPNADEEKTAAALKEQGIVVEMAAYSNIPPLVRDPDACFDALNARRVMAKRITPNGVLVDGRSPIDKVFDKPERPLLVMLNNSDKQERAQHETPPFVDELE